MSSVRLPKPTPALVRSYIRRFDKEEDSVELTLAKLFSLFPKNMVLEDVLLKVVALNSLYRTRILANDIEAVAKHILKLQVDAGLQAGRSEAVDLIASVQLGKRERYNYSFATKYCSWHNREAYPIYDKRVNEILWGYKKQDQFAAFQRQTLWKYNEFKRIIMEFSAYYKLEVFTFKELDKFLWLASYDYYD
jgi:hypothetical protein